MGHHEEAHLGPSLWLLLTTQPSFYPSTTILCVPFCTRLPRWLLFHPSHSPTLSCVIPRLGAVASFLSCSQQPIHLTWLNQRTPDWGDVYRLNHYVEEKFLCKQSFTVRLLFMTSFLICLFFFLFSSLAGMETPGEVSSIVHLIHVSLRLTFSILRRNCALGVPWITSFSFFHPPPLLSCLTFTHYPQHTHFPHLLGPHGNIWQQVIQLQRLIKTE